MPSTALLPLAPIRHVYVKIHPAIETKDVPLSVIRAQCHEVRTVLTLLTLISPELEIHKLVEILRGIVIGQVCIPCQIR